jgi:hypothetical protein
VAAPRGAALAAREAPVEESTPGLRRLATRRPNQAHAALTYSVTTLQRAGGAGANIDIYV